MKQRNSNLTFHLLSQLFNGSKLDFVRKTSAFRVWNAHSTIRTWVCLTGSMEMTLKENENKSRDKNLNEWNTYALSPSIAIVPKKRIMPKIKGTKESKRMVENLCLKMRIFVRWTVRLCVFCCKSKNLIFLQVFVVFVKKISKEWNKIFLYTSQKVLFPSNQFIPPVIRVASVQFSLK